MGCLRCSEPLDGLTQEHSLPAVPLLWKCTWLAKPSGWFPAIASGRGGACSFGDRHLPHPVGGSVAPGWADSRAFPAWYAPGLFSHLGHLHHLGLVFRSGGAWLVGEQAHPSIAAVIETRRACIWCV